MTRSKPRRRKRAGDLAAAAAADRRHPRRDLSAPAPRHRGRASGPMRSGLPTPRRCGGAPAGSGGAGPALVVRATDAAGIVTGVQLIALKDDGSAAKHWEHDGKLKLSFGTLSGCRRAPARRRPRIAARRRDRKPLCRAGTQPALRRGAISARSPGRRSTRVPLDRLIVVCADDDPRNAQSNKALRDAIRDWRRQGRRVALVKPHRLTKRDKSDFNDTLRAEGREAVRARIMAAIDAGPAAEILPGVAEARDAGRRDDRRRDRRPAQPQPVPPVCEHASPRRSVLSASCAF